jgi:hypothetical protein
MNCLPIRIPTAEAILLFVGMLLAFAYLGRLPRPFGWQPYGAGAVRSCETKWRPSRSGTQMPGIKRIRRRQCSEKRINAYEHAQEAPI